MDLLDSIFVVLLVAFGWLILVAIPSFVGIVSAWKISYPYMAEVIGCLAIAVFAATLLFIFRRSKPNRRLLWGIVSTWLVATGGCFLISLFQE